MSKTDRTQFTFYESFYNAVCKIRKMSDRAKAYDILCRFALYGEEPDLETAPDSISVFYEMVRPNLMAGRNKSKAGKAGGSKPQANPKQTEANAKQTEANPKQEKEQEKDKEQMLLGNKTSASPPTLTEVREFCRAEGLKIDPEKFFHYYAAVDWMRGRSRITDWKALARTWEPEEPGTVDSLEDYVPFPAPKNWLEYDPAVDGGT